MLNSSGNRKAAAVLSVVAFSVIAFFSLSSRSNEQVVSGSGSNDGRTAYSAPVGTRASLMAPPPATANRSAHGDTQGPHDSAFQMKVMDAYVTSRQCATVMRSIDSMRRQISACDAVASTAPGSEARCRENTAGFDEKVKASEALLSSCGQKSQASLEKEFYDNVVLAAKQGIEDARICYVSSSFDLGRDWSPEEIAQYKNDAPKYIDDALNQGDWRAVGLMMTSPRVLSHLTNSLLGQIVTGDAATTYRMNRLARLGATDGYAAQLDTMAQYPDQPLSSQDIVQGDLWAKRMYEQHFLRSPALSGAPAYCE